MQKLGILFTSRNNYEMFDLWFASTTNEGFEVLSIDEDSTPENKQKGKDICKKHGITYMDREKRGMFNNIETAKNYFKSKGIEWVIWFQHDCFPLTEDFFTKLNNLISQLSGIHWEKRHVEYGECEEHDVGDLRNNIY